jgi:uracil-DNA glycosylase
MTKKAALTQLLDNIRACRLCQAHLPLGPNPVIRAKASARLLVIGQAPGTKVHQTSIPWNDASGKRLREWLGMSAEQFYDEQLVAIMPMGFCYPGKGKSGDLPPRPECAPQWHQQVTRLLPDIQLTLLIGQYAQRYYLADKKATLTEQVKAYQQYLPHFFPLPHPSPRNQLWLKKNPWFSQQTLVALRQQLDKVLMR